MRLPVRYTKEKLAEAVAANDTLAGILRHLGVDYVSGHLYRHIRQKIDEFDIDASHVVRGASWAKGRPSTTKQSPEQILRRSERRMRREDTHRLRRALLESGVAHCCISCGLSGVWQDLPIVLYIY